MTELFFIPVGSAMFDATFDQGGVSLRCSYELLAGMQLANGSHRTDRTHLQFVNLFH